MTLAVSTSGPFATVALFNGEEVVKRGVQESRRAASGAIVALMSELEIGRFDDILVDIGPGSFTGVRVGVAMAKVWSHMGGLPIRVATSFDLISNGPVAIPSKKGEVFLRIPGEAPTSVPIQEAEIVNGVVMAGDNEFRNLFAHFPAHATLVEVAHVVPLYVAPPAISTAKQRHIMGETFGGRQDV